MRFTDKARSVPESIAPCTKEEGIAYGGRTAQTFRVVKRDLMSAGVLKTKIL